MKLLALLLSPLSTKQAARLAAEARADVLKRDPIYDC
jgi:DhnA family fructose-bisphosphate aldolase class Ia